MTPEQVGIELSRDEALVLYEWVRRFNMREDVDFEDQAEERVLWDIEASLESALDEPFGDGYTDLLAVARDRVRDSNE